ncbi:MAG: SprT-like domain-containing protein [Clostridium sp.]|nr:SprT-like domain-containing protein [Prevotella sp.]MCM1429232.1 SprT-like domain-containing protein [Clostridium sp.]
MRPTIPFLIDRYRKFNILLFAGKLPMIPLYIGRGKKTLGSLRFKYRKNADGSRNAFDFKIVVSGAFDRSQEALEDILIHEMIHYYEFVDTGNVESTPHGPFFRREMQRINREFGRNVTIREDLSEEDRSTDSTVSVNLFGIIRMQDGKLGLTKIARSRVFELYDKWEQSPSVEKVDWYYTLDPTLNRYRRFQTTKYYQITEKIASQLISHPSVARAEMTIRKGRRSFGPVGT